MVKIQAIAEEKSIRQSNDRYRQSMSSNEELLNYSQQDREKIETERQETERFMKMTHAQRGDQFTKWLLEEENKFLTQISELIKLD